MKPDNKWINSWVIGVEPVRENNISKSLVNFFLDFWDKQKLDEKSKSTTNRYTGSLHAIGGYLVERAISDEDINKTLEELLFEHIYPDDGPLIHHDNETWQKEIDMVSRKIYKFIKMDLNWSNYGK